MDWFDQIYPTILANPVESIAVLALVLFIAQAMGWLKPGDGSHGGGYDGGDGDGGCGD